MVSDSNLSKNSYSSDEKQKKRKLNKKHKHKEKKSKKDKKKEKTKKAFNPQDICTTTKDDKNLNEDEDVNSDVFGPVLPSHLLVRRELEKNIIGPVIPSNYIKEKDNIKNEFVPTVEKNDDSNENDMYGPLPIGVTPTNNQIELEKRALELKIAAIEGGSLQTTDAKTREEWMLELPEVGLRGGLAALSNMKRTFHQGKERPDFSDRSSWTKTPKSNNNQNCTEIKKTTESLKLEAEARYTRERDDEQEKLAHKHKKKHKRDESLLEIHQKKLHKERKKKEKELSETGAKPERRPFTRDIDLKLNKIDSHQTKQIVNKAKILNTKFSSGEAKYL